MALNSKLNLAKLPVDASIPEILAHLGSFGSVVIVAPPGTGKTTRVPPAVLDAFCPTSDDGEVIVIEPRRLAAKLSALRVAEERGEAIGQTVGYRFRGETVAGPKTRLTFYTEGTLTRRLLRDPQLKGVSAVVIDEFHERHLTGDLALALLRRLQLTSRSDLKLAVMSATLDAESLSQYFNGAPIVQVDASTFPVEVEYMPPIGPRSLEVSVEAALEHVRTRTEGDVLVFLAGMGDILRCSERLQASAKRNGFIVAPLHGSLSKSEQELAVTKQERRKIVLSTNIAESSLTIPGVTAVIDSGLHRQASFSWWSGVPMLATKGISRASAIQRAGRAGRLAPGFCVRLYSKGEFEGRAMFDAAEIKRADLMQTVLELKCLDQGDPTQLPWFESPEANRVQASVAVLYRLGALDSEDPRLARVTSLGEQMVRLPTHPRLARILIEGKKLGILDQAAIVATMIENGDWRGPQQVGPVEVNERGAKGGSGQSGLATRNAREIARLIEIAEDLVVPKVANAFGTNDERLARALMAAYPDRIAKKRKTPGSSQSLEFVFANGGSCEVAQNAFVTSHDYFVVCDAQETKEGVREKVVVHAAAAIEEDWLLDLNPTPLKDERVLVWDKSKQRVFEVDRMKCDELVLSEQTRPASPSYNTTTFLFHQAFGLKLEQFNNGSVNEQWGKLKQALEGRTDIDALETELSKIVLVAGEAALGRNLLSAILSVISGDENSGDGVSSIDDLQRIDWTQRLSSHYPSDVLGRKDHLVPDRLQLPAGRKARVYYRMGQAPWVESRLQDFFGMKDTPKILGGKTALVVHLLAPNGRAVQVTQDLGGFWVRTYTEVRKELMRRYPKHKWPENP